MLTGQEIRDYVQAHRDEMVGCLSEILKVPSVTGNEQAVSRVFKRYIEELGIPVQEIREPMGRGRVRSRTALSMAVEPAT